MHLHKAANALLLSLGSIQSICTGFKNSGINANERERTDKGICHNFESKRGEGLIIRRLPAKLFFWVIHITSFDSFQVQRGGKISYDSIQKWLDSFVLESRPTAHWHKGTTNCPLPDQCLELFLIRKFSVKIGHHSIIINLNCCLNQFLTIFLCNIFEIIWNFQFIIRCTKIFPIPNNGLHLDQIHNTIECFLSPDWNLYH